MRIGPRLGPFLVVAGGLALLALRWDAWPDPSVDFGREIYTAWRISEGDLLQRDVAWLNGPLSPHVNALWLVLFGASVRSLVLANLGLLASFTYLVYRILLDRSSHVAASAGAALLLSVFALGQHLRMDAFNYLAPYSHEPVHGLYLATLLLFLAFHGRPGRARWFGAGLCLGLLGLTRPETFLAGAAGLAAGGLAGELGRPGRTAGCFALGTLLPVAAAWLLLAPGLGPGGAAGALAGAWPAVLEGAAWSLDFYRNMAGLEAPGIHLAELLLWGLLWAGALAACALASGLPRRLGRLLPPALMAGAVLLSRPLLEWTEASRPLPLLAAGVLILVLARRGAAPDRPGRSAEAAWAALALVLPLRLGLKPTFLSYGFTLLLPAALLAVVVLVDRIPAVLARRGLDGRAFALSAGLLLAALALAHLRFTVEHTALRNERVGRGADALLADQRGETVRRVLEALAARVGPAQTLAVLPEGALINFLARRRNPTAHVNLMPPELLLFTEERILAAFEAAPPDFVLLAARPMPEYAVPAFGRGHADRLHAWIRGRYRTLLAVRAKAPFPPGLPFEEFELLGRAGE